MFAALLQLSVPHIHPGKGSIDIKVSFQALSMSSPPLVTAVPQLNTTRDFFSVSVLLLPLDRSAIYSPWQGPRVYGRAPIPKAREECSVFCSTR
jgi:hypothetical protein